MIMQNKQSTLTDEELNLDDMEGLVPAGAVVNEILRIAEDENISDMTHLKLQKMLYFVHGVFLSQFKKPLIKEAFEAWDYGPVIRDIYQEYKNCGTNRIPSSSSSCDYKADTPKPYVLSNILDKYESISQVEFAIEVGTNLYLRKPVSELRKISHDKAWGIAIESKDGLIKKMSNKGIYEIFKQRLDNFVANDDPDKDIAEF